MGGVGGTRLASARKVGGGGRSPERASDEKGSEWPMLLSMGRPATARRHEAKSGSTFCLLLAGWEQWEDTRGGAGKAQCEGRKFKEPSLASAGRREWVCVGGAAAGMDRAVVQQHQQMLRIQSATWAAARAESDQVRAVRLLQIGRIWKVKQFQEKTKENHG